MGTDRAPTLANSAVLRGLADSDMAAIIVKGKNKMPAFALPQADIDPIVRYIRSLNAAPAADRGCRRCQGRREHLLWRGAVLLLPHGGGPGKLLRTRSLQHRQPAEPAALQQALTNPGSSAGSGGGGGGRRWRRRLWGRSRHLRQCHRDPERWQQAAGAQPRPGQPRPGLADQGRQTAPASDGEYRSVVPDSTPVMPAYQGDRRSSSAT